MATKSTALSAYAKNRKKIRTGSWIAEAVIYLVIGVIATSTLIPFVFVISASFSDPMALNSGKVWLWPVGFSLISYGQVFASATIIRSFFNSVLFTVVITTLNVLNSMLAGYALCKRGLVFRKAIVLYILIPMYFSGGLIPTFIIISSLGMYNTLWAIILPGIVSIWNIILARTYVSGLPASLKEAAIIDGANEMKVFGSIILPLSKPIIAVLALYTALGVWNSWFNFMIFIPKLTDWQPLQILLTKVLIWGDINSTLSMGNNVNPELIKQKLLLAAVGVQMKYTVMVVATVPIMLVYPFIQKYFIQGALLGSLKE
jgi:putative aldouronate transport system permease protein